MWILKCGVILILIAHAYSYKPEIQDVRAILKRFYHNLNATCDYIECPPVAEADATCIRVNSKTEDNAIYMIAGNKCQVKYVKCHTDLVVKVLPFSNCTKPDNNINTILDGSRSRKKRRKPPIKPPVKPVKPGKRPEVQIEIDGTVEQRPAEDSERLKDDAYSNECPTSCPTSNRMVCGRCPHGVYKSFLSVCHLRMYMCNRKGEKLTLVLRGPCPYSAPYLSDPGMGPVGPALDRIDDAIERFIKCREKHHVRDNGNHIPESFKVDPKCQFEGLNIVSAERETLFSITCNKCNNWNVNVYNNKPGAAEDNTEKYNTEKYNTEKYNTEKYTPYTGW